MRSIVSFLWLVATGVALIGARMSRPASFATVALTLVSFWAVATSMQSRWKNLRFWMLYAAFVVAHIAVLSAIGWDQSIRPYSVIVVCGLESFIAATSIAFLVDQTANSD